MPTTAPGVRQFYYWAKWDKDREPIMLVAKSYEEFKWLLDREVMTKGDLPEWIIRDYTKA